MINNKNERFYWDNNELIINEQIRLPGLTYTPEQLDAIWPDYSKQCKNK